MKRKTLGQILHSAMDPHAPWLTPWARLRDADRTACEEGARAVIAEHERRKRAKAKKGVKRG